MMLVVVLGVGVVVVPVVVVVVKTCDASGGGGVDSGTGAAAVTADTVAAVSRCLGTPPGCKARCHGYSVHHECAWCTVTSLTRRCLLWWFGTLDVACRL